MTCLARTGPRLVVASAVPGPSGVQIRGLFGRVLESEGSVFLLEREIHAASGSQLQRPVRIFWKTFKNSHCPGLASEDAALNRPGLGLVSTSLWTRMPCSPWAGSRCSVSPAGTGRRPEASWACALRPGSRPRSIRNDVVSALSWSQGDGWLPSGTERPKCHLVIYNEKMYEAMVPA